MLAHLISTLHDAEFISAIPMTRDELSSFIPQLVSIYTDTILRERDAVQERLVSSVSKVNKLYFLNL